MMAEDQTQKENSGYEPIFSYGHLRANYVGSNMVDGVLPVTQFVRKEHVAALHHALLADQKSLSSGHSHFLQRTVTPVTRQCLWELQSGIMLRVLENITGLHNLLPDTRCKQTRVLQSVKQTTEASAWHDNETNLHAALVLLIELDTGNAYLFTVANRLDSINQDGSALYVTYWQHQPDNCGTA